MNSQAVDMWTMRWRAPTPTVDNAKALPTAVVFDHMTTASHHQEIKPQRTPRAHWRGSGPGGSVLLRRIHLKVGQIYFGVDSYSSTWPAWVQALE